MSTLILFGIYACLTLTKPSPSTTDTETWVETNLE
jgi:hypothetical protein